MLLPPSTLLRNTLTLKGRVFFAGTRGVSCWEPEINAAAGPFQHLFEPPARPSMFGIVRAGVQYYTRYGSRGPGEGGAEVNRWVDPAMTIREYLLGQDSFDPADIEAMSA